MTDNLSLNGSGGITRRMTDKEELAELTKKYNNLRDGVEDIIKGGDAKTVLFIQIEVLQQLLKEE